MYVHGPTTCLPLSEISMYWLNHRLIPTQSDNTWVSLAGSISAFCVPHVLKPNFFNMSANLEPCVCVRIQRHVRIRHLRHLSAKCKCIVVWALCSLPFHERYTTHGLKRNRFHCLFFGFLIGKMQMNWRILIVKFCIDLPNEVNESEKHSIASDNRGQRPIECHVTRR